MFLGGSYHDRDNPQRLRSSHGKPTVLMTLVCTRNEGRQQSSSRRRGLRTTGDDEDDDEDDNDDDYFLGRNWYNMYRAPNSNAKRPRTVVLALDRSDDGRCRSSTDSTQARTKPTDPRWAQTDKP
jgi:hypothetical protein